METKPTSHIIKALLIALVLIVVSTLLFVGNVDQSKSWPQFVVYGLYIAGLIWSCITFGKQHNNNVTFGSTFGHGFKITAVVTIIMILFILLMLSIFPEMKEKTLAIMRQKLAENPQMNDEVIEKSVGIYQKNYMLIMAGGTLFGYMLFGVIGSLIGAAVTKKSPSNPFEKGTR